MLFYLFFEVALVPMYFIIGIWGHELRSDPRSNEATLKFFIFAAVAMAIMAYGFSFLFGLTGSLELRAIGTILFINRGNRW